MSRSASSWARYVDAASGNPYWYDVTTGTSTWINPDKKSRAQRKADKKARKAARKAEVAAVAGGLSRRNPFRRKGEPPPASTHQRWSQHTGVSWRQQRGQWEAYCHYDGKKHHLGFFDDEREAAAAYRAAREKYGAKSSKRSSKYKGVSWWKADQKWRARIHYGGKAHHIGYVIRT